MAADGVVGDWFGASVAISGDTAIIGAPKDNDNRVLLGAGYIFTRSPGDDGTWAQVQERAPGGAAYVARELPTADAAPDQSVDEGASGDPEQVGQPEPGPGVAELLVVTDPRRGAARES